MNTSTDHSDAWAKAMGELAAAAKKAHRLGKKCRFDVQTNVKVRPLKTSKKKAVK